MSGRTGESVRGGRRRECVPEDIFAGPFHEENVFGRAVLPEDGFPAAQAFSRACAVLFDVFFSVLGKFFQ